MRHIYALVHCLICIQFPSRSGTVRKQISKKVDKKAGKGSYIAISRSLFAVLMALRGSGWYRCTRPQAAITTMIVVIDVSQATKNQNLLGCKKLPINKKKKRGGCGHGGRDKRTTVKFSRLENKSHGYRSLNGLRRLTSDQHQHRPQCSSLPQLSNLEIYSVCIFSLIYSLF